MQIWAKSGDASAPCWQAHSLAEDLYALNPGAGLAPCPQSGEPDDAAVLLLRSAVAPSSFALIAHQPTWLNGAPLLTGLALLCDRDEIRFRDGARYYFSSERLAVVEPYPGGAANAHCVRCASPIERGSPAVRCAGCALWFHQSAEFPCFTYAETCPSCKAPTSLDAGFRWTPEEI